MTKLKKNMKSNLLKRNKQLYHVVLLLLVITATVGVISYNNLFCDGQIIGKWIGLGVSLCITTLFIAMTSTYEECGFDIIAIPFLIASIIVSIHSLLQITGVIHVNTVNGYRVLAGFDNPAGVAASLTVSLPFTLALIDKVKDRVIKNVALSGTCGVVLTILVIARSRVGILASGIVLLLYVLHTLKDVKTRKIMAALLSLILLAVVVYMSFSKRGSNSGRALILGVCWDMFKDAPLFGHGLHGFRSQYMLYQADYLEHCGSSVLPMLADNTTHPLNEYALLAVNFGVIGIATLLIGIIMTIMHYFKNQSNESFVGIMTIAGIGVLSMFSYPFRYPLTLLGLLCALLLVYKDVLLNLSRTTMIIIRSTTATISSLFLCLIIIWAHYQIQWKKLSVVSDNGNETKAVLEGYDILYPKLKNDPYFLYNYAYVLSENGDCKKAGDMAIDSFGLMANYDTALLIADNAKECGDVDMAEEFYWVASKMCPVRFMPLYGLFCLYKELDRTDDMLEIGQTILSKPVKINSNEIRTIRSNVKQTLIKM
ncbi:MAG: O-antigen ligase family protein [Bacteroidaceae bacterium]|nr:O-antigen ligase family protein [Bacteroidaceae bacterium]